MGRNWAICVGINEYYNLQPLSYAVQDAVAMRDFFTQDVRFEQVYYFSDNSPQIETPRGPIRSLPTFANLKRFLRERFQQPFLQSGDNLWFFFAGHGEFDGGHDYLMPIDVDPGNLDQTALRLSDVTATLRGCGADNVVLLLDACRSQGKRSGQGFGNEEQPGMVTVYSCSPREASYEIKALNHGAFTYALLEGLRLQGAQNCATVERLDQYLRYQVPDLNQRHGKPRQTPYTAVEPISKNHLILLPQMATLQDVLALKNDALWAEAEEAFTLAEQLWIRVLAASPADLQAIKALQRIALQRAIQPQTPEPPSKSLKTVGRGVESAITSDLNSPTVQSLTQSRIIPLLKQLKRDLATYDPKGKLNSDQANLREKGLIQNPYGCFIKPKLEPLLEDPQVCDLLPGNLYQQIEPLVYEDLSIQEAIDRIEALLNRLDSQTPVLQPFEFEVMTVDATGKELPRQFMRAWSFTEDLGNGVGLEMVSLPGDTFTMSSPGTEEGRTDAERSQHRVTIQPFFIGKYPVTQAQWQAVAALPKVNLDLDPDPAHFKGDNRPVEKISWFEAVEFCDRLNRFVEARLSRKTGQQYRLPSEAEWEYACRAGTTTPFYFGETITTDLANYNGNYTYGSGLKGVYREQTTDVGSFPPNAFGLYDMHGSVWEWCADTWHDNYEGAPIEGSAWVEGGDQSYRVLRGGSWVLNPRYCRSAFRSRDDPDLTSYVIGFRVICSAPRT